MTMNPDTPARRFSPRAVREASFSSRRRGVDENEVRRFLAGVAEQLESADAERARLRAELDGLRNRLDQGGDPQVINPQAIALFSQAQQVADNLVAEAVEHAKSLMSDARKQQRELLEKARQAVGDAVPRVEAASREPNPYVAGAHTTREVEYVRTFAKVAQVQLRSVLEALTEQVDRLAEADEAEAARAGSVLHAGPVAPPPMEMYGETSGPVRWRFDRSGQPQGPADSDAFSEVTRARP